ncbi:MAG: S-adenosylmethionine:tRNA ribosyltransferase-isomerase [Coprobacter sp.]|nr:S-adenosylmethionine:tRNA ribosyltransferase-isomerase [Coprobacter sp.]
MSYFENKCPNCGATVINGDTYCRTCSTPLDYKPTHQEALLYDIKKSDLHLFIDKNSSRYVDIFAKNEGAVVAPAAGLHFSREMMKRLEIRGIDTAFLTLHIGLGSFKDIDVEDLTKHKMDSEPMIITDEFAKTVNAVKDAERKVCVIGTSTMRAIETAVCTGTHINEYEGWTNKFIFPPYEFSIANAMLTNFHLPLSTMLMMTASFGGYDNTMAAYQEAVKEGYRFGAYGDAMLIVD